MKTPSYLLLLTSSAGLLLPPSSASSFFQRLLPSKHSSPFVVSEAALSALASSPPTILSSSSSSSSSTTIDIASIGSLSRLDHLTSQIETWASHASVRHYYGFSELQDYNVECADMSEKRRADIVDKCRRKDYGGSDGNKKLSEFFGKYYGLTEGNRVRSDDAGWICAQRRVGRALGYLNARYGGVSGDGDDDVESIDIPDYLMVVDDDTHVDLVNVVGYLENHQEQAGDASVVAGCLFRENDALPFPIAYGGFGTILNKEAVQQLTQPIYCYDNHDTSTTTSSNKLHNDLVCNQIKQDLAGEAFLFRQGMTTLELFYRYSALKDFCMHSDWLLGYIFRYYLSSSSSSTTTAAAASTDHDTAHHEQELHSLVGIKNYPSCGNLTITGQVRQCNLDDTCHNQNPKDMEYLALHSYSQSPESYTALPKLELTEYHTANELVKEIQLLNNAIDNSILPNVMVVDSSSGITDFLLSNGACGSSSRQDLNFFDNNQGAVSRGIEYYSKYFEHCTDNDLIVDSSPKNLMHASQVHDVYKHVLGGDSGLKLIVVIDDSNLGELVRYLQNWMNEFPRDDMLVLSLNEMKSVPHKSQWRIEQFLGKSFQVQLKSASVAGISSSASSTIKALEVQEFHNFMNVAKGPWMEQHHIVASKSSSGSGFAYASVLGYNPDESQNILYRDALRVMIRSLKSSDADFIVFMMYRNKDTKTLLEAEGAIIHHIDPMKHSLDVSYFEPWFVDIALAKLRAFELTQYKRVQLLDIDSLITSSENMDVMFTLYPDAKLVAEGLGADSPLRAGWLMIKPSTHDFTKMEQLLERGTFSIEHGWDNLDLPVEYPGWTSEKPVNNWEFYGSVLEQGLLFHQFYALPKNINPSSKDSELLTLLDDNALSLHGFIHFFGERKPWAKSIDTSLFPAYVNEARAQWLKNFEDLTSLAETNHVNHLTQFGIEQYLQARVLQTYTSPPTPSIYVTTAPTSFYATSTPTKAPVTSSPVTTTPTTSTPPPTSSPVTTDPTLAPSPTLSPVTNAPTTSKPTNSSPVTTAPTTSAPTKAPTTAPTTSSPVTTAPTTSTPPSPLPTSSPVTTVPTTSSPPPTPSPVLTDPTLQPSPTLSPVTSAPTTSKPTTSSPVTTAPTTSAPTKAPTKAPTTSTTVPTTSSPVTTAPTTSSPVTSLPVTTIPTLSSPPPASSPVTTAPTTSSPTNAPVGGSITAPPTSSPVTTAPSTGAPTTSPTRAPTTPSPVTTAPTTPSPVSKVPPTSVSPITPSPSSASPITTAPVTASPTAFLKTTIQMDSTLTWNITCDPIVNNATLRIDLAEIIEESIYTTVEPQLASGIALEVVYVYELCGVTVESHTGYPPARRLQAAASDVKVYQVLSAECGSCQEEMFNNTNSALETVVKNGTLSTTVQQKSGNIITAVFDEAVSSNYTSSTSRPTSLPSKKPSKAPVTPKPVTPKPVNTKSSKSNPSPTTPKPVTAKSSKSNTPPVTPKPVTAKSSKSNPSSTTPPSPVTAKPVTPRPTTAKSVKEPKESKDPKSSK